MVLSVKKIQFQQNKRVANKPLVWILLVGGGGGVEVELVTFFVENDT